ncbi:MAG: M6 family metalloprotease domain-containing protein [Solirubrobacteraceae bacterium]
MNVRRTSMTRVLARAGGGVLAAACILTASAASAYAALADPNVITTVRQPGGSALRVHLWGDEFIHGYETTDGYTIAYDDKDKTYKYAARDARGRLKPSTDVAKRGGSPGRQKHLRPTVAAYDAARIAAGAPSAGALAAAAAPNWAGDDTDILFLMVEFKDTKCTFTPAQMQANMFGGGATGPGDLDDYFNEISYGKLKVAGNVVGNADGTACIKLANDRAFYSNNDDKPETAADNNRDDELVTEAVNAAKGYVNFQDYDNNNDDVVDALGIIYAGGGQHDACAPASTPAGISGDHLWPHSTDHVATVEADERTVKPYIINSELTYEVKDPRPACVEMQTIGLFAHELGHSLGLPDLYDVAEKDDPKDEDKEDTEGGSGVDTWSAMASQYVSTKNNADTPPHYDAWSKAFQGWVTPVVHQPGDRFVEPIAQVEDGGEVHQFRDNPGGFQMGGSGEYFLVENRQKTKFDKGLSGCGLLVWHIDEVKTNNHNGGHTASFHRLVDIDEADGLADLDANRGADDGDPFPGSSNNLLWGDATNPSSKLYDGTSSNVRMKVQSTTCATSMTAGFGPNQPPTASAGGPYTTPEGTNVTLTAAASSDPDGDALTYAWDLDGDGEFDDSTELTPIFTDVGDNATKTVKVRVTDAIGDSAVAEGTVTIENVTPKVVKVENDGPKVENAAVNVSGVASDPGWLDGLTATIDWGDGAGSQTLTGTTENERDDATFTFSQSHTYGDNGEYTVTVCVTDDDGAVTAPCSTTLVSMTNVNPTATIDESGAVSFNGVPTVIARAGTPQSLTGGSTDPGSDDLWLTWSWADGSADTMTGYLVNPPLADLLKSPSIQPRELTDTQSHAFTACLYDVGFRAVDDDGGASATDTVRVLVTGSADAGRQSGYWAHQYRLKGKGNFDAKTLTCYLQIAGFASKVFHELRDVSTFDLASKLLFSAGSSVSKRDQLARDLLTAWLNFANGAVGYAEMVDTDGNGTKDTQFHTAVETAEAVALNASATAAQLDGQRVIINRINDSI